MAKKTVPVSVSGGAGFGFEDQIAAWFMAHLLCNRLPIGPDFGFIASIDFQVSESGWILDDLLITAKKDEKDISRRLPISIKRDRQVTKNGFPENFVSAAWEEWLGIRSSNFGKDKDALCLAVGKLADNVKVAWDEMISQALLVDPVRFSARFSSSYESSNKIQRALFSSLQCPPHLKQTNGTEEIDIANLLKHIRLLSFDFIASHSQDESSAIQLCQSCLVSGLGEEAILLWRDLISIASEMRQHGGTVNLSILLPRLSKYSFKDFPDFHADWVVLEKMTREALDEVRTEIGQGVTIPREEFANGINHKLNISHIQALIGESGIGKSAFAKTLAESGTFDKVVWFSSEQFSDLSLQTFCKAHGLQHDLMEILPSAGSSRNLLVIDGAEKFSQKALGILGRIIKALEVEAEGSRWFIVLTAQPPAWPNIERQLLFGNIKAVSDIVKTVPLPDWHVLSPVIKSLPGLDALILRPELQPILCNLKILDWVAKAASVNKPDPNNLICLTDVINWIWSSWVESGVDKYACSGLLQKLGNDEAESFASGVALVHLTTPDQSLISTLENLQLLTVKNQRVGFTHDLLGDWSRYQSLIGYDATKIIEALRTRAINPRWHNAIRLYGLKSLESSPDASGWNQLLKQLNNGSDYGVLASDLILESVIYANNAGVLLERIWPWLAIDNGLLLQRLLKSFYHIASFPDPRVFKLSNDADLILQLSSIMRIPYWPYWGAMLTFLRNHADDVKKLSFERAAGLCQLWLSQMPFTFQSGEPFLGRREAAELALLIAREMQALKAESVYFADDTDQSAYEAFLYGAPDLPDEVSALALELAKRRPAAPEIQKREIEYQRKMTQEHEKNLKENQEYRKRLSTVSLSSFRGELMAPWPDGPTERIDESFQKSCMEKNALNILMRYRPEVAQEVILALCISHPVYEYDYGNSFDRMHHGIAWSSQEGMFFRGPFLSFLKINPECAIHTITKLVNFATERWREWAVAPNGISWGSDINNDQTIDLWVDDKKLNWLGDMRVFGWYRDRLVQSEYLVSALMAIEKWLYEEVGSGKDISAWINRLFEEANSTAFAGVLAAVGKKHPELFKKELKPILSLWQIYNWDLSIQNDDCSGMQLMNWIRYGETTFNMVRDWHAMPHRKVLLREKIKELMITDQSLQKYLTEVIEKWKAVLENTKCRDDLAFLIECFNIKNYKLHEEENKILIALELPAQMEESNQAAWKHSAYMLTLLNFPYYCRELINKDSPLSKEDLDKLWHDLQYLADNFDTEENIRYLYNALMAGITVLYAFHREWLQQNDSNKKWCISKINDVIKAKHDRDRIDTPHDISETNWEAFFGEIAVYSLLENPDDENIRKIIAESVFAFHYKTTELVCRAAYRCRKPLGPAFGQILNLCRYWAGIRWVYICSERYKIKNNKIQKWHDSVCKLYIKGTLPSEPTPWEEIAKKSNKLIREIEAQYRKNNKKIYGNGSLTEKKSKEVITRKDPGLDWEIIKAAYNWLTIIEAPQNAIERQNWIAIHKDLFELELQYLRKSEEGEDDDAEIKGTPYEFERWIFDLAVKLISRLKSDEKSEQFWQPILDLGAEAHYWVDGFLSGWFVHGANLANNPQLFCIHWQSMIRYTLDSPVWRISHKGKFRFHLSGLYKQLMGLDFGVEIIGKEEYRTQIDEMIPLYDKWAEEWLFEPSLVSAFSNFLLKPSAFNMLCPGILWIARGVEAIKNDYHWRSNNVSEGLMSLLNYFWLNKRAEVETEKEIKDAFLKILNVLVLKQYPGAFEFRDQMIRQR